MKVVLAIATVLVVVALGVLSSSKNQQSVIPPPQSSDQQVIPSTSPANQIPATETLVTGLDTPWAIAFLPDKSLLVTQRVGKIVRIVNNKLDTSWEANINSAREIGEGGLLGIAVHPDFVTNHFVYLYYTYRGGGNEVINRLVRVVYTDNTFTNEEILLDNIPGSSNHDGGRIKFGPDKLLYIGTGDGEQPSRAQDTSSPAGKILRVTETGQPASGNPFSSVVFSYGHRNVQGLAWDKNGTLFASEHGRSGIVSGLDEINRIESGVNYGWPTIQGTETKTGMITPLVNSGSATWAPSGMAYYKDSLYFGGLRGQALFEAVLKGNTIVKIREHFKGKFGRIRDVVLGPDNMLYITTSNKDGRGKPLSEDDRVIRIDPAQL